MSTYRYILPDSIVIERAELPPVTVTCGMARAGKSAISIDDMDGETAAARSRRRCLEDLALAEHLTTYPPVSDEDVETLAGLLCDVEMDHPNGPVPFTVARRLLATGPVSVRHE